MKISHFAILAATTACLAVPALAQDIDAGEKLFTRCKACHSVTAGDGTPVVRGGKVGPDLFGIVGRPLASVEGYSYGAGIQAARDTGLVWDPALLAEYVQDPTKFIDTHGGSGASKMVFKLPKGGADIAAYLATLK